MSLTYFTKHDGTYFIKHNGTLTLGQADLMLYLSIRGFPVAPFFLPPLAITCEGTRETEGERKRERETA
jgi:hypothetical protein